MRDIVSNFERNQKNFNKRFKTREKVFSGFKFFFVALFITAMVGEVKCIIKAAKCNWNPVGKAEVIYTIAACSSLGAVVGYIDIEDK